MAEKQIKIYYDTHGNTLSVWFDDPKNEYICEETGDEVILIKDKKRKVIGFEKLNFIKKYGLAIGKFHFPIKAQILHTKAA